MVNCPVCRDGSAVQKVSAIVASGSGSYSGSGVGVAFGPGGPAVVPTFSSGTTTSRLASALAYPAPPPRSGWLPVLGGALVLLSLLPGAFWAQQVVKYGPGSMSSLAFLVLTLLAGLLGLTTIVGHVRGSRSRARQQPMVQAAQRRWSELYYCYRDDAVFHPATGAWRPPDAVHDLVWSP